MSPGIAVYAELLQNIRALSIIVTLSTNSDSQTSVALSRDGECLTVLHAQESLTVTLPAAAHVKGGCALDIPATPAAVLNFRLQLPDDRAVQSEKDGRFDGGNITPWNARQLIGAGILCQGCKAVLLKPSAVTDWRDLPSDDWAEMMDLWHCHRPHEAEHDGAGASKKGYAASSRLTAAAGLGFASLLYVLLHEQDCQNIRVVSENLTCASCNAALGSRDASSNGLKLRKSQLAAVHQQTRQTFPFEKWQSAQLLASIDSDGARRFLIESDAPTSSALLCWVFADDLFFTSSTTSQQRSDPTRALKILWQPVDDGAAALRGAHMSMEHVHVAPDALARLVDTLAASAGLLPAGLRNFQGWRVGLLQRFSGDDVVEKERADVELQREKGE